MPAPSITIFLPVPDPGASWGGPAHASGRLIRPSAVIVSYTAAEPPAIPTRSRKRLRVKPFFCFVIEFLQGVESEIALGTGGIDFRRLTRQAECVAYFLLLPPTSRGNDCNAITLETRWFE